MKDFYVRYGHGFRSQRVLGFYRECGMGNNTTVLDVGGTPLFWDLAPFKPKLCLLNHQIKSWDGRKADIGADACHLPFRDKSFDIVFRNH